MYSYFDIVRGQSWSWSYGSWIYNYLCKSVSITTKVVSSNPTHGKVYSIQHYVIVCLWLSAGLWFSPGTLVSSTSKTDCHRKFWCRSILAFFLQKRVVLFWCVKFWPFSFLVCLILATFGSHVFNFFVS